MKYIRTQNNNKLTCMRKTFISFNTIITEVVKLFKMLTT